MKIGNSSTRLTEEILERSTSLATARTPAGLHGARHTEAFTVLPSDARRVLRNTYALLSMTLLFAAGIAAMSTSLALPAPGIILTLVGYVGLLFAIHKLKHSGWALPAVFALTGFMGYSLGPVLAHIRFDDIDIVGLINRGINHIQYKLRAVLSTQCVRVGDQ